MAAPPDRCRRDRKPGPACSAACSRGRRTRATGDARRLVRTLLLPAAYRTQTRATGVPPADRQSPASPGRETSFRTQDTRPPALEDPHHKAHTSPTLLPPKRQLYDICGERGEAGAPKARRRRRPPALPPAATPSPWTPQTACKSGSLAAIRGAGGARVRGPQGESLDLGAPIPIMRRSLRLRCVRGRGFPTAGRPFKGTGARKAQGSKFHSEAG